MRHAFHSSLASLCALAFAGMATPDPAMARVGVTSETNGDPKGKPPADDERILRVGIDIQADEIITTGDNDRAHLVFLDGTALTVSPNARLKIDRFVYDPASKSGEIALSVTQGVFRLVGGRISKSKPIVVNTPSASIGLRGGIGVFAVGGSQTTAQFLFGNSMTVTAGGRTETAVRPGSQINAGIGGVPTVPAMIANGALAGTLGRLEGARAATTGGAAPDEQAKRSGFSDQNSGRGPLPPAAVNARVESLSQSITSNVLSQNRPQQATLPTVPAPQAPAMQTVAAPPVVAASPPPPPPPPPPAPLCDHYSYRHVQRH